MANFINLLGKRYNINTIFKYEPAVMRYDPLVRVTFIDRGLDDLYINFKSVQERDTYIADMDRKMVVVNA